MSMGSICIKRDLKVEENVEAIPTHTESDLKILLQESFGKWKKSKSSLDYHLHAKEWKRNECLVRGKRDLSDFHQWHCFMNPLPDLEQSENKGAFPNVDCAIRSFFPDSDHLVVPEYHDIPSLEQATETISGENLHSQSASLNVGRGEAGALVRHILKGGIIIWPYDRDVRGPPGKNGATGANFAVLCGFLSPYPIPPNSSHPVEATISTFAGKAFTETEIEMSLSEFASSNSSPSEGENRSWRETLPGTFRFRNTRLLLIGYDGVSETPIIASFGAWRASNLHLVSTLGGQNLGGRETLTGEGKEGGEGDVFNPMVTERRRMGGLCLLLKKKVQDEDAAI